MIQTIEDLKKLPKFKRALEYYFLYFIPTEGKHALIENT
jgi:hypothetical protein